MLKNILFIAKKDFLYSLKDKSLLVWMFIMPLVFFGFIGSTTGGLGEQTGKLNIAIWESVEGMSQSDELSMQMVKNLEQENFTIKIFNQTTKTKEMKYHFQDYTRRLWLPEKMQEKLNEGKKISIEYASSADGIKKDKDKFSIEKAVYKTLGDVLVFKKIKNNTKNIKFDEINNLQNNINLTVDSAGEKRAIPSGYKQAVPGILVMFIMMIALSSGSVALFLERQSGVLKRLAATPITRTEIVLGKWMGKWFITLLQLAYGMFMGWVVFEIYWGNHLMTIIIVLSIWSAFNASLAILLGSFAKSEGQVALIATVSSLLFAALGGCWWPIEITPQWMQNLAHFLPTGWIMDVLHQLMYFGGNIAEISWQIMALIIISVISLSMAFRRFKFF